MKRYKVHILAFILSIMFLIIGSISVDLYEKSKVEKIKAEISTNGNKLNALIGDYINTSLHISQTLSYIIAQNKGLDNIDYTINNILKDYNNKYIVELAPKGVIKNIYPNTSENNSMLNKKMKVYEGSPKNKIASLGKDIHTITPISLYNGKTGMVSSGKVYIENKGKKEFWGVVGTIIEEETIKDEVNKIFENKYDYEIYYKGSGSKEIIVSNTLDKLKETEKIEVSTSNENWVIGINKENIYNQINFLGLLRILSMIFAILSYIIIAVICENSIMLQEKISEVSSFNYKLKKLKEKYKNFFAMSPDYIFIIDVETKKIIEANDTFYNDIEYFCNYEDGGIELPNTEEMVDRIYHDKELKGMKLEVLTQDNEYKELEINSRILTYENSSNKILCFGRDLSQKRKIEKIQKEKEEKEKKLIEFQEYDKIKTEFFANISHEFRTPLNVILGSIQLISLNLKKEGDIREDINRNNRVMKQNCFRLLRLINNIIDVTKSESDFLYLQLKVMNIIALIEDITISVVDYAKIKGVEVEFDTEIEEVYMKCDPDKIERIILNILSNAIKFTGKDDKIFVDIKDYEDKIRISIRDTGIGIAEANLKNIFNRFSQVNKSFRRDSEGSGIGLSLAKSLVELHNGSIWVESIYGEGSIFFIELPKNILNEEDYAECEIVHPSNEKGDLVEKIDIEFSDIYFNS